MSIDLDKNKESILKVYNDVLDDKTSTDWALFGYEGLSNILKVVGFGDEGLEELSEDLNASKIMYGVIRLTDPKASRTKIVLINWQGEAAPNLRKGVCARHLPEVKRMLKGVHITFSARTEEDVDSSIILNAVAKATATEYNFSERSEIPEKNVPVGTNYKRTNPQKEIDANKRNRFWEEQEAEEKIRKELEIKKREEDAKLLEKERMDREVRESKMREQINKERNAKIFAEKKAETLATERTKPKEDVKVWEREVESQHSEEIERSRRADQMRMERKKEAESLIGKSTHLARSMFEPHPYSQQNYSSAYQLDSKNRPPRVLKEFNPAQNESSLNSKENLAPKRSIGSRWPPVGSSEEEEEKQQAVKVPGRISEWKPQTEDAFKPMNQATRENDVSFTKNELPCLSLDQNQSKITTHFKQTTPSAGLNNATSVSPFLNESYITHTSTTSSVAQSSYKLESTHTSHTNELSSAVTVSQVAETASLSHSVSPNMTQTHTVDSTSYVNPSSSATNQNYITHAKEFTRSYSPKSYEPHSPSSPKSPTRFSSPEHLNGVCGSNADAEAYSNGITHSKLSDIMLLEETPSYQDDVDSFAMTYEVDGVEYQILPEHGLCARALYDYQAADETEITFDPGDIITNIDQIDVGWWQGVNSLGIFGLFPANYVELINGTKAH